MTTKTKPKPGGQRKGAGRPAIFGERKETTTIRLTPDVIRYLKQLDSGNVSHEIERMVRRQPGFRRFMAEG